MQAKKVLSTFLKLGVSAVLIGYLAVTAASDPKFTVLLKGEKNWRVLAAALPVCLFAVTLTILRWQLLVRAIGLSFTIGETFHRFLGYLANLLPLGLVAGDSLKSVMLIHRNPQRKTKRLLPFWLIACSDFTRCSCSLQLPRCYCLPNKWRSWE
ncbi:MAG: hypothetical protein QM778_00495 [Myxococcales bacterium]